MDVNHPLVRLAFSAGWNATKYVVCNRTPEEDERSFREQHEAAFAEFEKHARYLSFSPLTEADIARAHELANKHGWE